MAEMTLSELRAPVAPAHDVQVGFQTVQGFEMLQRMARMFSKSTLVPTTFQGDANLGNAAIALDMAFRIGVNPLAVMQNIYIIHGRPAWSAQFLIATLNKTGRFSSLDYEFQGTEGKDDWGCRAVAKELATGEVRRGPLITIALAKAEGWFDKSGSKWKSLPELMLRYRAASWFVRAFAPEIAMGLPEAEEVRDTIDVTPVAVEKPSLTIDELKAGAHGNDAGSVPVLPSEDMQQEAPAALEVTPEPVKVKATKKATKAAPAPEFEAVLGSFTVMCPRTGQYVDEKSCAGKPCMDGCPEF